MIDLQNVRNENTLMVNSLFEVTGVKFEETSELQRQLMAAFGFGMIYADGRIKGLSAAQVHGMAILMLQDVFFYSLKQASEFASFLIEASSDRKVHSTIYSIIRLGITGHSQWEKQQLSAYKENIEQVFKEIIN